MQICTSPKFHQDLVDNCIMGLTAVLLGQSELVVAIGINRMIFFLCFNNRVIIIKLLSPASNYLPFTCEAAILSISEILTSSCELLLACTPVFPFEPEFDVPKTPGSVFCFFSSAKWKLPSLI